MADDKDDDGGTQPDSHVKTRGRTRICKSCKFTCTDSKEFLNHQVYAHSQDGDPDLLASLGSRRKSQNSSFSHNHTKKHLPRSKSSSDVVVSPPEKLVTQKSERSLRSGSSTEVVNTSPPEGSKEIEKDNSDKTEQTDTLESEKDNSNKTEQIDTLESEQDNSDKAKQSDTLETNIKEQDNDIETSDSMSDTQEQRSDINTSNDLAIDNRDMSDLEMEMNMEDKVSEQTYILNPDGDDQDDEGRLIIAEDEPKLSSQQIITQPTRSGNIQNRTYVCNLCEFSSTSAKIFLHHQKDNHNLDITIYECDICEYATKYKQKLPRHRKLHFTGKENGMMSGSDLDSSFGEKNFHAEDRDMDLREHLLGEEDEDEEAFDEEEEEEETSIPVVTENSTEAAPGEKKKRKTRQEVDPAKYFEVLDEAGIKYACSKCGNVYKWRKSLNKHWKEKHFGDLPDTARPPPGLAKLNTISHVKYRIPSSYEGNGRMSVSPSLGSHKGGRSNTATPQSLHGYTVHSEQPEELLMPSASSVVMPKFIGPFITNTAIYPAKKSHGQALAEALHGDKVRRSMQMERQNGSRPSSGSKMTEQPLDFSVKKELDINKNIRYGEGKTYVSIKSEPRWNEYSEINGNDSEMPNKMRLPVCIEKKEELPILHCSRCGFVAKTLVDYSSHMTLHLNKRAFKCAECQEHFNGVDELNKHFLDEHSEKIHEHKEAIQKIPHGLQQTYHLLKMPLNAIGSMTTQEIGNGEPKYLKCSMCNFVAKWPAELQKHAVSHSEERPFVCMVCGSTYKWKWDLVKHFEKSHSSLPNPYKRREQGAIATPTSSLSSEGSKPRTTSISPPSSSERSSATPNSLSSLSNMYEISSRQVMSSTAAALLDAGSHNIRKIPFSKIQDELEPTKKKRRLSDTDLPQEKHQGQNSSDGYMLSGLDGMNQERPSSEPLATLNKEDSQDAFMREHLQLHSVKTSTSLKDMQNLIPYDDISFQEELQSKFGLSTSPLSSDTQKSILDIMRKRLEAGKLSPSDKNNLAMDKSGKVTPSDILLPYRCTRCEYRARWPSEITQHMKNHSDEKPYHCPRCSYKSKWKWDVVKHLKRCGGGTIRDVIDTSRLKKMPPPNVTVMPQGTLQQQTPQPVSYKMNSSQEDENDGESLHNGISKQAMEYYKNAELESLYQKYEDEFNQDEGTDTSGSGGDPSNQRQPVFRSLINQGMYHCLECPFIGHSPAELRRHAVLHSENKPFTCTICGYSSRWKCDLKKHIRTYGHFDINASNKYKELEDYEAPMYLQDQYKLNTILSNTPMDEELGDQDRTLYKCDKCLYVTYKKSSYDTHVIIHGDAKKEEGGSSPKFKCKQCDYQAEDLSSFLQHKKTHTAAPSPSAPSQDQPAEQVSNRTLHLKHRRKPVQQFKCSKCPYTCFKRSGLALHEAMHEPRGAEAFICLYCDYNVYSKNLVLQHMRLHPEFDAQECQDFLRDDDDMDAYESNNESNNDDCLVVDDMEQEDMEREYMEKYQGSSDKVTESTEMTSKLPPYQNVKPSPKQSEGLDLSAGALDLTSMSQACTTNPQPSSIFGRGNPNNRFPCEWCSAMFPNVVTVYQHARTAHPFELRAQEMGEAMSLPTKTPATNPTSAFTSKPDKPASFFGSQSQQQNNSIHAHQQTEAHSKPQPSHQQPRHLHSQLFNQTFIQHQRYRPIEPKPQQQQLNIQNIPKPTIPVSSSPSLHQRLQEMSNKITSAVTPSQPKSQPSTPSPQQLAQHHLLQQLKAKKSTSPHKRGRSFQCTKCSFTAPNAVTYLRHIERHGSNCRHTCRFCDYSIDRLNLLYQHMKGTHSDLWRGTPEEKINLTSNGSRHEHRSKMSHNMDYSFDGMSNNMSMEEFGDAKGSGGEESLNSSLASNDFSMMAYKDDNKAIMVLKEETTWRGIPVQVCTINGRKNYKCPKCSYVSSNAANTTNHVRQHGSNRKYKCEQCDYSVDNLKLIYHHMQSVHPSERNFLDKPDGKLPFTVEYDYLPEENNNSLMWGEEGFSNRNGALSTSQLVSCTKCPFKTNSMETIQRHQEMHEYNGLHSCEYCDFSVDSPGELVKHLVVHREPYEPEIVDDDFEDDHDNNLEEYGMYRETPTHHQQTANKVNMETEMDGGVPTHKLTQQFLKNILNRMKKNGERLRYKCARCPYFSFCKNNIIKHRRQHLIKSQYACQLCDYSATRAFLLAQHMKFHKEEEDEMVKMQEGGPKTGGTFQDVILDPFDKEGCNLLRNIETLDNKMVDKSGLSQDEQKDFEDEAMDEFEFEPEDENGQMDEFDEEEMAALERAEFEGMSNSKMETGLVKDDLVSEGQDMDILSNASDDSLSEIDPTALQQQISLNMSATVTNEEKIRYNCSLCPYKCNALRSFKCHIQMHGHNRKYICDYCNWSADRLNLLYQHRKVHINETGFILNQEDIVFLNRDFALEMDNKLTTNIMNLNPPAKTMISALPQEMDKEDPRRMFNRNFTGNKIYTCKLCPYSCNNKNIFDYHRNLHRIKAHYTCSECSYSVDRWNLLSRHMKLHQEEGLGRRQNRCPKCPYFNSKQQLLDAHVQCHGAGKEFSCKYCDYSLENQSSLLQHQMVHLTDESSCQSPILDEMDMKNFEPASPDVIAPQLYFNSSENDLDTDDDSTEDTVSDLKCNRCPYGTPSKDELADHEHQHNIHYEHACPYCDFSCQEYFQLVDHIQLHLPSTKVDRDVVNSILEKQSKHGDKALEVPEVPVVNFQNVRQPDTLGEPDSTTTSPPAQPGEAKTGAEVDNKMKAPKEKSKTKVYVCQYCEREFEGKNLMLQHERQHLIGSKY